MSNGNLKYSFLTTSSLTHEISEASFDPYHQLCKIATLVQTEPKTLADTLTGTESPLYSQSLCQSQVDFFFLNVLTDAI